MEINDFWIIIPLETLYKYAKWWLIIIPQKSSANFPEFSNIAYSLKVKCYANITIIINLKK